MNQAKRTKGRGGSGGFSRGRNRGQNSPHSHTFTNSQNDELKQPTQDIYQNSYLVHSIISLLGCLVDVTVTNGVVYEGVLKTVSQTLDVTLEMAHKVQKKNGQQKIEEFIPVPSKDLIIETLVIGLKHIVCISAKDVDLDEVKKADNFTDQAIATRVNGQAGYERQLQKWEDPSGEHEETIMLEDTSMKNGFDPKEMFATNEKKYGVKSSYDQNMLSYTTPVEGSKELEDKAETLAKEIEQENNFSDHTEIDSGKTEEELFSSVVRDSPAQGKPKTKDENKQDAGAEKGLSTVSPPKPQRVQQRERESKLSDNATKGTSVTEQVKPLSRDSVSANSISVEHEPKTDDSSAKPVSKPQVVALAAESGIANQDIRVNAQPKIPVKALREDAKVEQPENVVKELKSFANNFKLANTEETEAEHPNKDTPSSAQQPVPKEQTSSSTSEEQGVQQRDSPKVQEQQRKAETPPKMAEKEKSGSKLNANAKEFVPLARSTATTAYMRTSPVTSQQQFSPTPPVHSSPGYMIRPHQMKPQSRSPYNPQRTFFPGGRDHGDVHGNPTMTALAAAGSPIITQSPFHPVFAVQGQPFPGGMIQQVPQPTPYMLHAAPQGAQQHYMVSQSVGNTPVQSGAQTYQENSSVPVYAGNIQLPPSSPFQGSPQPSPTIQNPPLHYYPQVVAQQQGNQPHIPQAVMASPGQQPQMIMLSHPPPGAPPPHVGIPGIPVSSPAGGHMMQPFLHGGQVGYNVPRKAQPHQWTHQQHPNYPPSAT